MANTIPIKLTTLTPVHIGSGAELKGNFEYVYFPKEKQIVVIDPAKILDKIGDEHINQWVSIIDSQGNLLTLPQLRNAQPHEIAQRTIEVYAIAPNPDHNGIKEQTHLGNQQPTLPGSSLKGSIRTAVLAHLIQEKPAFVQAEKHLGSEMRNGMKYHDKQITAHYLCNETRTNRNGELQPSANKDLLRFLRVSDFYFEKRTTVVKNKIVNLFRHGWGEKKSESSYYECIPAQATATGSLQLPQEQIKQVQKQQYITQNLDKLHPSQLFELINDHTYLLLTKEIEFWEDENSPLTIGNYLDKLHNIKKQLDKIDGQKSCILRVGANSGWEFMTGGWAVGIDKNDEYILNDDTWVAIKRALRRGKYPDNTIFPKTRKMIEGGVPMGFVELSLA